MAGLFGENTEWLENTAWNIRLGYFSLVAQMVKNPLAMHLGSIPGLGKSPGGGHGNLLQYSCLENPMDRGTWQATVHRVAESDMPEVT